MVMLRDPPVPPPVPAGGLRGNRGAGQWKGIPPRTRAAPHAQARRRIESRAESGRQRPRSTSMRARRIPGGLRLARHRAGKVRHAVVLVTLALSAAALALWAASLQGVAGQVAGAGPSPAASLGPNSEIEEPTRERPPLRGPEPVLAAPRRSVAEGSARDLVLAGPEEGSECVSLGRIVDENGALIPRHEPVVRLRGPAGQLVVTGTDANGAWRIAGLEPGTWEVRGSAVEHLDACARIEVAPAASPEPIELRLAPAANLLVWIHPPRGAEFEHETLRNVLPRLRVRWGGSVARVCAGKVAGHEDGSVARAAGTLLEDGSFGLAARIERARDHTGWVELVLGETVLDGASAQPGLDEIHLTLDVELAYGVLGIRTLDGDPVDPERISMGRVLAVPAGPPR